MIWKSFAAGYFYGKITSLWCQLSVRIIFPHILLNIHQKKLPTGDLFITLSTRGHLFLTVSFFPLKCIHSLLLWCQDIIIKWFWDEEWGKVHMKCTSHKRFTKVSYDVINMTRSPASYLWNWAPSNSSTFFLKKFFGVTVRVTQSSTTWREVFRIG